MADYNSRYTGTQIDDGIATAYKNAPMSADLTLYVNASSGNDGNDGLSSSKAKKTIMAAINAIPKNLGKYIATVNVAAGTYNESITITGFFAGDGNGTASIRIDGASQSEVIINGGIYASGCACKVDVLDVTINGANSFGSCVHCYNCMWFFCMNLTINGSNATTDKIFTCFYCTASARNIVMNGKSGTSSFVTGSGILLLDNVSGKNNYLGIHAGISAAATPGLVLVGANTMECTVKYRKQFGGAIIENGVLV